MTQYKIKKGKVSSKKKALSIFNIPNSITLTRFLLIPLFIAKLLKNELYFALILYIVIIFSDRLDGFFARKLKQETYFGKCFDAVADTVLLYSAFLVFMLHDKISYVVFLLLIFPRIITLLTTFIISLVKKKKVHFITRLRKASALLFYILVIVIMFDFYVSLFVWIALLIAYAAVISDFVKLYLKKIKV